MQKEINFLEFFKRKNFISLRLKKTLKFTTTRKMSKEQGFDNYPFASINYFVSSVYYRQVVNVFAMFFCATKNCQNEHSLKCEFVIKYIFL